MCFCNLAGCAGKQTLSKIELKTGLEPATSALGVPRATIAPHERKIYNAQKILHQNILFFLILNLSQ
jgi:hypothetical protein